tara:strand:+ start:53 stop:556 length:504 start_codon:yes stop_codon:yes gene_type:complete
VKITRKQLRKLMQEVFKKGLSTKAIRRMSGLDDETVSTLEDIESQGPEYRKQAQELARSLGSLEPESIYYDMNQPDTNFEDLYIYRAEIYSFLDRLHSQFGPFNDKRFVSTANLKKYVKAKMYKMEEVKFVLALKTLVEDGLIEKKELENYEYEDDEPYTETYYGIS